MRYCKHGTCLCVEFRAKDIWVDANMCHCEHALAVHNLTGSTDESRRVFSGNRLSFEEVATLSEVEYNQYLAARDKYREGLRRG